MHILMSPFRFAGQWALFPLLLIGALIAGAATGGLSAWAATTPTIGQPELAHLVASPLTWIAATVVLGLMTNSWAISTIVGAVTMAAASATDGIVRGVLRDGVTVDGLEVASDVPLAILAGAGLGWAGCLWRHEGGWFRMLGAAVIAGSCLAIAWPELEPAGFTPALNELLGWVALGLAVLTILRTGSIGAMIAAAIGSVIIAFCVMLITGDVAFDIFDDLRREASNRGLEFPGLP